MFPKIQCSLTSTHDFDPSRYDGKSFMKSLIISLRKQDISMVYKNISKIKEAHCCPQNKNNKRRFC